MPDPKQPPMASLNQSIASSGGDVKVSFIIPAFNEESFITSCLASIRSLKGDPYEILVVDNNSTDGTAVIAKALCDRVIRCSIQGIGAARNEGAKHAKGKFLAFIDADAQVSEEWLEAGLRTAERSGVVTGWNYFRESNPILAVYFNSYSVVFFALQAVSALVGSSLVAGNNLLIRRDLFGQTGGFPRYVGEDVKLAKILAGLKVRAKLSLGMRIGYSSRRFRKQGFLRTMILWISSVFSNISEHDYRLDYTES
jgi:glycosyltransferase involved in cell wall biosynthesis